MPPELLAQFPIAEAAIEALGIVLWPMVEFEADDAIAAAAVRFAQDDRVERILVCTPDKDMAQLVRDERIVLWDRRRGLTYDDAGVRAKWGVPPTSIPDYLALVGDASDGYPGLPGLGRQGRGRGPGPLRALRGHPREGVGLGGAGRRWRSRDRPGGVAARPLGRGPPLSRPRPTANGRRTASRSASTTPTSCAGTARRATPGRRSARNGGSTGFEPGRTAGSTRADPGLADQLEQGPVVGDRRGKDADRLRPRARGRTTGRRPSPSPGRRPARRSAPRPRCPRPTGRPAG